MVMTGGGYADEPCAEENYQREERCSERCHGVSKVLFIIQWWVLNSFDLSCGLKGRGEWKETNVEEV